MMTNPKAIFAEVSSRTKNCNVLFIFSNFDGVQSSTPSNAFKISTSHRKCKLIFNQKKYSKTADALNLMISFAYIRLHNFWYVRLSRHSSEIEILPTLYSKSVVFLHVPPGIQFIKPMKSIYHAFHLLRLKKVNFLSNEVEWKFWMEFHEWGCMHIAYDS